MGSVINGSAATSSRRNPFRSSNVLGASSAATGGNFGSAAGSTTGDGAASNTDGQHRNVSRATRTKAAASLEVGRTSNLMDPLSMQQLREQFKPNQAPG